MSQAPIEVTGRSIGAGRTFVIAEVAWAHDGKVPQALELIRGAAKAGADCISLHVTDLAAYMVPHYGAGEGRVSAGRDVSKIYQYLEDINLPADCWEQLFAECREHRMAVAVMCNDFPSLELIRPLRPDIQVLAAACFMEQDFVAEVAAEGCPIALRTGGATLGEIERVLGWIRTARADAQVMLLHGQQNYPTKIEDTRLLQMKSLGEALDLPCGLADHVDGDDPMAVHIPLAAVALGAPIIEKHITHDRSAKAEDFESALDPEVFGQMVKGIRGMEAALGAPTLDLQSASQEAYRLVVRKRAVAARDLPAGHKLDKKDLAFKRTDEGVFPDQIGALLGRELKAAVTANEGIDWSKI